MKADDGPPCGRCQEKGLDCIPHQSKQGQHGLPKKAAVVKVKKKPVTMAERKAKSRANRSEEDNEKERDSNKA